MHRLPPALLVALLALPAAASDPVQITTTELGDGYVGGSYHWQLTAIGGTLSYSWTALDPLPPQLVLKSSGVLDGKLTKSGDFTLHVRVSSGTDSATAFLPLHVIDTADPLVIVTDHLPTAFENVPYSAQLIATGGEPPYTWHLGAGAPEWLVAGADVISGTPPAATPEPTPFTVAVEDGRGVQVEGNLQIAVAPALDFRITTTSVPDAAVGTAYGAEIVAEGGVAPFTYTVDGLPMGLELKPAEDRARIEGTPTESGLFPLEVRATDLDGRFARRQIFLTCLEGVVQVLTETLPGATVGKVYAVRLQSRPAAATWQLPSGKLPPGLTLSADGVIEGTPTREAAGLVFAFFAEAEVGGARGSRALSIAVDPLPPAPVPDGGSSGGCQCGGGVAGLAGLGALLLLKGRRQRLCTKRILRS